MFLGCTLQYKNPSIQASKKKNHTDHNTDHSSASRGPLPLLLSIIRAGNEACGRVSKQFFPQWKQGAAIFWAVWVTRSCSIVCLCVWAAVSTLRHVLFVRDPHKAMSLYVALCHCDFLNPTMYSWFIPGLYLLSLSLSLTEATQETLTDHTKTKRGGQYRWGLLYCTAIETHPDAKHRHTFIRNTYVHTQ